MLNATLFVLVGLVLRPIVESLGDRSQVTSCCGPRARRNGSLTSAACIIAANLQWRTCR